MSNHTESEDLTKMVPIVFLQGDDYEQAVDEINAYGGSTDAAVEYLSRWDYGDETDNAAEINGHSDISQNRPYHRVESNGLAYFFVADHSLGTYGLYRAPISADPNKVDRIKVNDALTNLLSGFGWKTEDDDDDEWLNDLTHKVADRIDAER